MGYLQEKHGVMLLGKTKPGVCKECATRHRPELPHNKDSLTYQYKFYDQNGRWPTWEDAMAHCSQEVKEAWINALEEMGEEVKK